MKLRLFVVVLFSAFFSFGLALGQESVEDLINKIDELHKKWDFNGTLETGKKAYEANPENFEVTWRLSRAYTDVAFRTADKKETEDLYKKAMEFGEKALNLKPDHAEGHFRYAVATGRLALFKGGKEKIKLSKGMKEELDKALKLDPDHALAYYALGRWHYGISDLSRILKIFAKIIYGGVPEASFEDAASNFEKSVKIKTDYVEGWFELGKTYRKTKKWQKANDALEKCISLPSVEVDDDKHKKEAGEILKKVKKKLK